MSNQNFEHRVLWTPAYNHPTEGGGRRSLGVTFCAIGPKGAVDFAFTTGIYCATDRDDIENGGLICLDGRRRPALGVLPYDLGRHSIEPRHPGESSQRCHLLACGRCYYNGSSLNAEDALDVLTDEGEEALWDLLHRFYAVIFDGASDDSIPEIGRRWNAMRAAK